MDFSKIPARRISFSLHTTVRGKLLGAQDVLGIIRIDSIEGQYSLRTPAGLVSVTMDTEMDANRMDREVLTGVPYLARITSAQSDGRVVLTVCVFDGKIEDFDIVEIGIDERLLNSVRRNQGHSVSAKGLCNVLQEEFVYKTADGTSWFFTLSGPAANAAFNAEENVPSKEDKEAGSRPPVAHPTHATAFQVICDQATFVAAETEVVRGHSIYLMSRYHQRKNRKVVDRSVRLTRGSLRFSDWTKTGAVSQIVRGQLAKIADDANGYLKKWDEFGNSEGEMLLAGARRAGVVHYTSFVQDKEDGQPILKVFLDGKAPEEWNNATSVEYISEKGDLPLYLKYPDLTFPDFVQRILPEGADVDETKVQTNPTFRLDAVSRGRTELYLKDAESLPSPTGRLIVSLVGDMTQIKRREEARRRINAGRSANSSLKLLIEAAGEPPIIMMPGKRYEAVTPFVRKKVFPTHAPTLKQEEAIRIALNTPDIALIQGPPGTGKTTVITAILERLNEIADKRNVNSGRVLLTGFQHDAVENMIDRVKINSLPVPKFGNRPNSDIDEEDVYRAKIEKWCKGIADKIRIRHPELCKTEDEARLDSLCLQYATVPSSALADRIIGLVSEDSSPVPDDLRARARKMLASVQRRNVDELRRAEALRCVRNLRTTAEGFLDDGPDRALELQCIIEDIGVECPAAQLESLDRATILPIGEAPEEALLDDLATLKFILLRNLAPAPHFRREKRNVEVSHLAADVRTAIREHRRNHQGGLEFAFARYLAVLEQNPDAVFETLADYSFAYAATCQQSVKIQNARALASEDSDGIEYDYVIIDEAARVGPRDLMIALAQGKKIVLVGDHRQLPHVVDEEVAKKLEAGHEHSESDELSWLKESMFEYLFTERLPELEKRDGIIRHVTLDMQYRMHPVLGDFISKNFYERFNAQEAVGSGLPETLFAHSLPGTDGMPVVWLDVPAALGAHERARSGSLFRDSEVSAIRKYYSMWSSSPMGQNLSYGIISFYRAQAKKIRKELGGKGDSDSFRVGTVDGFQGMEFDVVFLSLVRTSNLTQESGDMSEKAAARMYGFLSLYNRLNVSMSRQKKLLVLVGDSGLTRSPFAEKYIPGLVNFRKLCETQGKVVSYGS